MDNNVLGRVRKLIELSKSNNSPAEAASAAAMAADMMFKYSIGEADLDMGPTERVQEDVVEESVMKSAGKNREVWKGVLANTLARAFGCRCYTSRGLGDVKLQVFGLKSAVETVGYMFQYLSKEINRLADEGFARNSAGVHGKSFKNSFRMGAINTINSRLAEQTKAHQVTVRERVAAGGTAIALYKTDIERVDTGYKDLAKRLNLRTAPAAAPVRSFNAYAQGQKAGASLGLGGGKGLAASKSRIEA